MKGRMSEVIVPIQIEEGGSLPEYATEGAAGMDLRAKEDVSLQPLERKLVGTGLRMAIPAGYEAQVRPRSGLALRLGLSMVNAPGTIDSDYRGEIGVLLINLGSEPVHLEKGERVAQLVIAPVARAKLVRREDLDEQSTDRGEGGFGSTGTK
jgi:dUTP pyrophosphatase